ncbi:DNA repair protein RAD51-like protein 3, partial [Armadillidium nasatum]
NETDEADHIITFSEDLDNLLGGGFPLKSVMEISGTPGIGKTQMCLQACVSVQLPSCIGGVEGEAVYVDTEGSFSILRLKDSIAFHFRHDFTDMSARSSILCSMSQDLIHLASKHNLTVIVTNQMTTKVRAIGHSEIIPALGETWGHCPTIRLLLHWKGLSRIATVIKSPHIPLCTVEYQASFSPSISVR